MDILTELRAFDGKHTDVLERLAAVLSHKASVIGELSAIADSDDARLQTATTWLLKRFQENGVRYSQSQVESLLNLLGRVTHWEAKLHLLQMLPGLSIPASHKTSLRRLLQGHRSDGNKLVRAWSYNGLFALATQHPEFRSEVAVLLEKGQQEEAASVKARIRNILKTSKWPGAATASAARHGVNAQRDRK